MADLMNPVLVVNDETGEFVMSHNITRVSKRADGSLVYVRADISNGGNYNLSCCMESPLSPKELLRRLLNQETKS